MIGKLSRLVQQDFLADSESASDRNGYLSYRAEWHSAAWGFSVGVIAMLVGQPALLAAGVGWLLTRGGDEKVPGWLPYPRQFAKESLYVLGHAVAGVAIGLVIRGLIL